MIKFFKPWIIYLWRKTITHLSPPFCFCSADRRRMDLKWTQKFYIISIYKHFYLSFARIRQRLLFHWFYFWRFLSAKKGHQHLQISSNLRHIKINKNNRKQLLVYNICALIACTWWQKNDCFKSINWASKTPSFVYLSLNNTINHV